MTKRFFRNEGGATAIEYALIASFVFLAIVAAIIPIGTSLSNVFNDVVAGFN